jgi:hypothetical protein
MTPGTGYPVAIKLIVLGLFAVFFADASAQGTQGIITKNGDTIFCDYTVKSRYVTIKKTGSAPEMIESGKVLSAFSGGETFVVLFLTLETYSDVPDEIFDPLTKSRSFYDTTLLLSSVYSSPKMNLYEATDKRKVRYYFVKTPKDSLPAQLLIRYSMYFARAGELTTHGSPNLTIQRVYIDQLKGLMKDCPRLSGGDFEVVDYRGYSIKRIIKKYNKRCK